MSELADAVLATEQKMGALIEESSLGTAGARQLRGRVSPETANKVVAHAEANPLPDDTLLPPRPSALAGDPPTTNKSGGVQVISSDATEIFARLKSAAFSELVASSMAGEREAVATLFTWIRPVIVRYCRSRIGRSGSTYSTADDVAQEICVAVLGALTRYGDEPESFLPFVYGIAAHKIADHYRRAGRDRSDPAAEVPDGVDPDTSPEQLIMNAELRDRLRDLLNTLPPRQREILRLRLIVGLSAQETASHVGLTPSAVRVTQHRALAKLRGALFPAEWV
jgi:RNA polymerase sigma-70 factor, ECF subfamily